jgi:hypothetical protein
MFMANQQASELAEPGVGSLHNPAALITPQFAPIFVAPSLVVFAVGRNQFNPSLFQSLTQWVGVVGAVGDYALRLLPWAAFAAWNPDFGERGFRKRNFTGGGTFQPNSQRKTLTVDQYHPLRPLAPLGFPHGDAPFLAGAKLPSKKVSSHFNRPSSSSAPSRVRQAFNHTPLSSHCLSRRQQVEGEGNSSGKNRHAAPVCRTHRMPSKQPRFDAQGRPRLSCRRLGGGSMGSTNSHCSFVNSLCRFFMTEAHQLTRLIRKCLT